MSPVWPVILFYKYVPITDPHAFAQQQREFCASLRLKGRVLIATEGINGTLAGPPAAIDQYIEALKSDARFADVAFKLSAGDEKTFPKLVVKQRPEIVTLGAGPLESDQHNHLSPAEWKRMIEEDPDVVLLDVRNRFESDAGRFKGAVVSNIENFRDLPGYVDELEPLKAKKVLMYCTGGIRCEKASALLRSHGFNDVFQLHGGIVTYQEQFGNEHWQGECFVFDQRMTLRIDDGLVQIGRCAHSGRPTSRFVNCLHDPCHKLYLLAEETERESRDYLLCRECLGSGLTSDTAEYPSCRAGAPPAQSLSRAI
ncbi:MAG TPA: rhodanese-related sulfurtransferase [Chthoniobacterales bacterium]|nr:rhodanese-related sulfurtransferase [Chthoniobacterales bacterium]